MSPVRPFVTGHLFIRKFELLKSQPLVVKLQGGLTG